MADVTYRANLSAVSFPLISEEFGRTIIVKQQDQNFVPTVVSKADQDKDIGIPQAYYAHNVMPTNYGFKSVGFSTQFPPTGVSTFKQVFPFLSSTGEKAYLAINTDGSLYVSNAAVGYVWTALANTFSKAVVSAGTNTGSGQLTSLQVTAGSAAVTYTVTMTSATAFDVKIGATANTTGTVGTLCTTADGKTSFYVLAGDIAFIAGDSFSIELSAATFLGDATQATVVGNTYLCIASVGMFSYDFTLNTLYSVVPNGIAVSSLLGIAASGGYLIIYSEDAVAWSSLLDPLDFIPSLTTGAGGGSVEGAKGPLRKVVAFAGGFIVFTAVNGVGARASGNARYPFIFQEIPNCGGLTDLTLCSEEAEGSSAYAYTTHGLQQVNAIKAVTVSPEITDFLSGQYFEDFDASTLLFTRTKLNSPLKKRIEFISGRYLVLSYGIEEFTHAVIYDTALQRYGKIKLVHRSVFQFGFLDADSADTPKRQLAFLLADGTVKTLDFTASAYSADSILILGKYQYVRTRMLQLQSAEFETVDADAEFEVFDLPTLNGKTYLPAIAGYLAESDEGIRSYNFHNTGLNHSLVCKGNFRLNTCVLNFNVQGSR